MPALSIVVPVYNVEEYLASCLSSITGQSLEDIEVICVNDGSTDRSGEILKELAAADPRIRVITKPNGGLSSARNAGIEAMTGDYLMFVDSDDILEDDACRIVVEAFEHHKADLVTFGANIYPKEAGDEWLERALSPRDVVYDAFHIDILFKERSRPYAVRTACSQAFVQRTELRFDESVRFGEDMIFHFVAYPQAECTVLLSDKLYRYRIAHKDSLMATYDEKKLLKIKAHIVIVDRVLTEWRLRGWLYTYPQYMLAWALSFLLFDIASQRALAQEDLLRDLKSVFETAFEGIDVAHHSGTKAVTRRIYNTIVQAPESRRRFRMSIWQAGYWYLRHPDMGTGFARIMKAPITAARSVIRRIMSLFKK